MKTSTIITGSLLSMCVLLAVSWRVSRHRFIAQESDSIRSSVAIGTESERDGKGSKLAARNTKRFKTERERAIWEQTTESDKAIEEAHASGDNDEFMRLLRAEGERDPFEKTMEVLRIQMGSNWNPTITVREEKLTPEEHAELEQLQISQGGGYDSKLTSQEQFDLFCHVTKEFHERKRWKPSAKQPTRPESTPWVKPPPPERALDAKPNSPKP